MDTASRPPTSGSDALLATATPTAVTTPSAPDLGAPNGPDSAVDARVADVTTRDSRDNLLSLLSVRTLRLLELLRQADAEVALRLLRAHPAAAAELATVFTVTGGIQWLATRRDGQGAGHAVPQPVGPVPPGPSELAQSGVRALPSTPTLLSVEPTAPAALWGSDEERTQPSAPVPRQETAPASSWSAVGNSVQPLPMALQPRAVAAHAERMANPMAYGKEGREDDGEDTESSAMPSGLMPRRRVPRAAARR